MNKSVWMLGAIAAAMLFGSLPLLAGDDDHDGMRRMPQAAIDACKGKAAGEAVKFTGKRGEVEATCRQMKDQLIAVPNNMRERGERMRKHGAEACAGKAAGDAVTLKTPRGDVEAKCHMQGDQLVAVPNQRGEHIEKMRKGAEQACAGKSEGDEVSLNTPRGERKAICRTRDNKLIAVPKQRPAREEKDEDDFS